jgi:hypothetical protein
MILRWKRRSLIGLALSVTLGLVVALPATAAAVPTLTGESLRVSGAGFTGTFDCSTGGSYNASGTATGPYAGTFQESGGFGPLPILSATFTITSGTTTITGTKQQSEPLFGCPPLSVGAQRAAYTATIQTTNGSFHDRGMSVVGVDWGENTLDETFTSSLAEPVPIVGPTSKDQCKKGGWKAFPQFKNQGRCIAFVNRGP